MKGQEEQDNHSKELPVQDQENKKKQMTIAQKGDLKLFVKDNKLIEILNKKGIKYLLPIQYETFDYIYKGEDVVAKDRTGSGKTIAFSLPTILRLREQNKFKGPRETRFLIVLPTRQLAIQVKDEIDSIAFRDRNDYNVVAVYGGANMGDQIRSLSRGADIIVGTPGRLIDLLDKGYVKLKGLDCICLDEADEMLNIGFKDDIQLIFKYIYQSNTNKVQCLMFSATIPEWVWDISQKYQSQAVKFVDMMKDGFTKTSKTVQHYCLESNQSSKEYYIGPLIDYFFKGKQGKIIIFCETKRQVQRIGYSGSIPLPVEMLHGDFKQPQRQKVFRKFKSGQAECLIATNVAARGLDFPEIDLIIQMQPPNSTDSYIHRSGRTGRAGKTGICVTLYSFSKENYLMGMIEKEAKIKFTPVNTKDVKPIQRPPPKNFGAWKGESSSQNTNNYSNNSNSNYQNSKDDKYNQKDNKDQKGYINKDKNKEYPNVNNVSSQIQTKNNVELKGVWNRNVKQDDSIFKGCYNQNNKRNNNYTNNNNKYQNNKQNNKDNKDKQKTTSIGSGFDGGYENHLSKYFNSSLPKQQ